MRSEGYGTLSVCVCVCVTQHLTFRVTIQATNHLLPNEGQAIFGNTSFKSYGVIYISRTASTAILRVSADSGFSEKPNEKLSTTTTTRVNQCKAASYFSLSPSFSICCSNVTTPGVLLRMPVTSPTLCTSVLFCFFCVSLEREVWFLQFQTQLSAITERCLHSVYNTRSVCGCEQALSSSLRRGFSTSVLFINRRRACAARVTVLGLCVCVCVRRSILAPRAITRQRRDTSDFSVTWAAKLKRRFV